MRLPGKLPLNTIYKKLPKLNKAQSDAISNSVSISPSNVVSIDTKEILYKRNRKTFSIRLEKWVEPYTIKGIRYSLFYTEVNHNFEIGDRIFIIGGEYDSNDLIEANRYGKGIDGYKVLFVDRCKLVIDIEYTAVDPFNVDPVDDFIKVYVASTQYEFEYYLQSLTMRGDYIDSKFKSQSNNLLYLNGTFSVTPGFYNNIQSFLGYPLVFTTTNGNGFFSIVSAGVSNFLFNCSPNVLDYTILAFLNVDYTDPTSEYYNNGKMRIINKSFTHAGQKFKKGISYQYVGSEWEVDKSYLQPIVTEQNFRGGNFDNGEFNQGLFGQYTNEIIWNSPGTKWNLGSVLNTQWQGGMIDSNVFQSESHFTVFDDNGYPQIMGNSENNASRGYNYIYDSEFLGGGVSNGNVYKLNTINGTSSSLERYVKSLTATYSVNLTGGAYYDSNIMSSNVKNSTLLNSSIVNSLVDNSKSVNSEISSSVFNNSNYISDKVVKIEKYEESNITWYDETSAINYKMYKFYVSERNFKQLNEFQNYYFQDLIINLPSTELLHFFDDKFSLGHYTQTYDGPNNKIGRKILSQLSTTEENRNSPADIISGSVSLISTSYNLPSLDLFIENGDDFNYGASSSYPRPFIGNILDIKNGYIVDSDFVSGLFKDSTWVSGNYINYNLDYSFRQDLPAPGFFAILGPMFAVSDSGVYKTASLSSATQDITIVTPESQRPNILGTNSNSQIGFINALYYDTSLNGETNMVKMPDTYQITDMSPVTGGRGIVLQDVLTQSIISDLTDFTDQEYFKTPWAENRWNYIHPVKFENSRINSGIFRRSYFDGCTFDNKILDNTDKDLNDRNNKRELLISDVIFDDNSNTINNAFVQYSHMMSGDDTWNNGIFHRGVWNGTTFTYSYHGTSSTFFSRADAEFNNGVFRKSKWAYGIFNNGTFYKNGSNPMLGGYTTVLGYLSAYYSNFYGQVNTEVWYDGIFNNGDFEKSNFAKGEFNGGNFYDSNFMYGFINSGNFGKKNIPYEKTRIFSANISYANIINSNVRAQNAVGDLNFSPPGTLVGDIHWHNGIFNGGVFGNEYSVSSPGTWSATWENGKFNGGEFTDLALWKDGTFNGGKFTSVIGYDYITPQTPFVMNTATESSYSWLDGTFNGGEFGNGSTGSNSLWMKGEFNGGEFQGRYWNDGVFTRGKFTGHASTASGYSTDGGFTTFSVANYNHFALSYNYDYYGYWNNGFVTENKDKFIKDKKIYTKVERESTKKKKIKDVEFKNSYWSSGTFSHTDARMKNCVWRDGSFENGLFYKSVFNPYINLATPIFVYGATASDWIIYGSVSQVNNGYYYDGSISGTASILQIGSLQEGEYYTMQIQVITNNLNSAFYSPDGISIICSSGETGVFRVGFTASSDNYTIFINDTGDMIFTNPVIYQGDISGFNTSDSCVWDNGISEESDFYYSKWKQGRFKSLSTSNQGNAWGMIWEDGICEYMNANNVMWKGGTWRNGNWNGSPFSEIITNYSNIGIAGTNVYPGFSEDIMNNISINGTGYGYSDIHMNNTFIYALATHLLSDESLYNGFGAGNSVIQFGSNWSHLSNFLYTQVQTTNPTLYATSSAGSPQYGLSIFRETRQYSVSINYLIFSLLQADIVEFEVRIGDPSYGGIVEYVSDVNPKSYSPFGWVYESTLTYNITPTQQLTGVGASLNLRKTTSAGTLAINNISITTSDTIYDEPTNNELHTPGAWTHQIGATISLPLENIGGGILSYGFGQIQTVFGNGSFQAGIWENGIWNQGWRQDDTLIWADDIDYFIGGKGHAYRKDQWTWAVKLKLVPGTQSQSTIDSYEIGDRVSVGNLITIDINNNRRLISSYLNVIDKSTTSITLSVDIDFPIRSIEKDSDEHIIYISKNIWLNGVFLNGRFQNGVWNNGLLQGFPHITEMVDSHWIDGSFKGGHFQGLTSSYINNTAKEVIYHTGVIQKFNFYDENISGAPVKFKYNSWIDTNYFEESGVNINKTNIKHSNTPLFFTASHDSNNFYSYPTKDVLESTSRIRNGFDTNYRNYKLGWKFKEYQNWIPIDDEDQFRNVNQYAWANTFNGNQTAEHVQFPTDDLLVSLGILLFGNENLLLDGWTFSYIKSSSTASVWPLPAYGYSWSEISVINTNYGILDVNMERKLLFNKTSKPDADWGTENFSLDFINNTNIDIRPLRYSYVEITADNFGYNWANRDPLVESPQVFYNNYPATYSIASVNYDTNTGNGLAGWDVILPINQLRTESVTGQREYFFNKTKLELSILGISSTASGTYSLGFEEIKMVEVDMIPFFKLGNVNPDIQVPYSAVAPDIDYTDANFSYISSITLISPENEGGVIITSNPAAPGGGGSPPSIPSKN